jgi:hypothetical protein
MSSVKASISEGNFSKACKLLLSSGVCIITDSVVAALAALHPARFDEIPARASLPPALQLSPAEVLRGLDSFPSCSGSGPSKLWPQNIKDAVPSIL